MIAYTGKMLVLVGQPRRHLKEARSQRSPILWLSSIYAYTLCELPNVTCVGRASILGSATPPISRELSSSAPQFWGFSCVYAYTL